MTTPMPPPVPSADSAASSKIQSGHEMNLVDDDASTDYEDASSNDLTIVTSALLLTADCMGTGILALPADVQTLGRGVGLAFLVLNLPVNLYAGTILSWCALFVEKKVVDDSSSYELEEKEEYEVELRNYESTKSIGEARKSDTAQFKAKSSRQKNCKQYTSVHGHELREQSSDVPIRSGLKHKSGDESSMQHHWNEDDEISIAKPQAHSHIDTGTFDFVGMASMLFDEPILPQITKDFNYNSDQITTEKNRNDGQDIEQQRYGRHRSVTYKHPFTKLVLLIYYVNLFLVLGNYILVMSHAVSAMAGQNNLCIPTAGIVASTLMFGLSQLRTMANLGRSVSVMSLVALFIVVIQCLNALRSGDESRSDETIYATTSEETTKTTESESILAKMSSLAAIGFAVGSQKLLLNIRHEMVDRTKAAPQSLSIALSLYGIAYIIVCLLAGDTPPSFLFDAIPNGSGRRIAGFLLWIHVAVSYAINSQALCSSLDRLTHSYGILGMNCLEGWHRVRWLILTAIVAVTSYLVANAVPFFKDLVALCGALTSVPLTLLLPAMFYRRVQCVPLFLPTLHSKCSYALLLFSVLFMLVGLIGAIGSIDVDWKNKRGVFSCQ